MTENWEHKLIEKLALEAIKEQRRSRQWGILFKLLALTFLFLLFFAWMGWLTNAEHLSSGEHTARIDIAGVIESEGRTNATKIIAALQAAFKDKSTKGVILRINSPGGSPVQAGQIYDEIKRLKKKYPDTPIYAVVEDIGASGGYYIAAAADRIYVDKASLIGSIGVLMDGFGFTGSMDKLGIERRLLTAGENKGFLDPFSPIDAKQREYAQKMLAEIHQQFINAVREGRGKRLTETAELFSGLVWNGQKSVELGLADDFGSVESVAREVIEAEYILDYTPQDNFFERASRHLSTALGKGLTAAVVDSSIKLR